MRRDWKNLFKQNRKMILFLFGQAVSLFGSSLVQFAIFWYVVRISSSGKVVAIATICSMLPQVLMSLFGGVLADRYNRKHLIMLADGGIAIATFVLAALMLLGYENLTIILIVSSIRSLGSGIQNPAVSALIPQLVPEEGLMKFNSINGTIQSFVMLVSPAVGGAVLALGSLPMVLLIDVITAIIGIGTMVTIKVPPHSRSLELKRKSPIFDLKEGISYAIKQPFLKRLSIYYLMWSIVLVPPMILNILFVTRVYGESYFYLTLNEIAFFVGSVVGGVLLAAVGGFKNRLTTLCVGALTFGVATFMTGLKLPFWIYLILMFLAGLTMPTFQTPIMVLLQEKIEENILGRVFSFIQIMSMTVTMCATLFLGPLSDKVAIEWLLLGSGALLVCLCGVMFHDKKFMREGIAEE